MSDCAPLPPVAFPACRRRRHPHHRLAITIVACHGRRVCVVATSWVFVSVAAPGVVVIIAPHMYRAPDATIVHHLPVVAASVVITWLSSSHKRIPPPHPPPAPSPFAQIRTRDLVEYLTTPVYARGLTSADAYGQRMRIRRRWPCAPPLPSSSFCPGGHTPLHIP